MKKSKIYEKQYNFDVPISPDCILQMVESLGVSKPVLVNVIFCHQEEANW